MVNYFKIDRNDMPIYQYKCSECQKITEELRSITDDPPNIICSCGAMAYKIISQSTFHLKGEGWFKPSKEE